MNMDKISWTYTQYVELIPENQLINTRYVYYAIFTLVFQYIYFFKSRSFNHNLEWYIRLELGTYCRKSNTVARPAQNPFF